VPATIRVVLTGDNHLSRFYGRMSPDKLDKRRRRLRRGFAAAVEHALEVHADFFLQAGDLFDTPIPNNGDRTFIARELARLRKANITVCGIAGNHDLPRMRTEESGRMPQDIYAELGAIHLFDETRTINAQEYVCKGLRVAVGGLSPAPSLQSTQDPLAGIPFPISDADIGILLLHHTLEGHTFVGYDECVVRQASMQDLVGVQYLFAGHVHRSREMQIGPLTAIVPGATERMRFGEMDMTPGFYDLLLGVAGPVDIRHIKTAAQPRGELRLRTTDLPADQEPDAAIISRLEPFCTEETMVKLQLEGPLTRDRFHSLNLRRVIEFASQRSFSFEIDTTGLSIEDELHRVAGRGIRVSQPEEIAAVASELAAEAQDEATGSLILEARDLLLGRYQTLSGVET
jgi:DNA repair exonuclease SbcCD nuclease subunit